MQAATLVLLTTWFDWLELVVGLAGPFALAFIGYLIHRATVRVEHRQWTNQKVIERRIVLFDQMAPLLNQIYCYMTWNGRWKEYSPPEMIETKRRLDELFHINRYLLSEQVEETYTAFIDTCFLNNWQSNRDALILSTVDSYMGNRASSYTRGAWKREWEDHLLGPSGPPATYIARRLQDLIGPMAPDPGFDDIEAAVRAAVRTRYDDLTQAMALDLDQVQPVKGNRPA